MNKIIWFVEKCQNGSYRTSQFFEWFTWRLQNLVWWLERIERDKKRHIEKERRVSRECAKAAQEEWERTHIYGNGKGMIV